LATKIKNKIIGCPNCFSNLTSPPSPHDTLRRVDVIVEFLEAAVHHVLHARGLYPKELFEARKLFGSRVMKARHPDLEQYIEGAVYALRSPIARGDVKRVVLVIKDGDAEGNGGPLVGLYSC
jgi:hypothetical protein